jgi:Fumarylacetoacetase N-terminal domain 2
VKLATLRTAKPDGDLVVVSGDLAHMIRADDIAPTLQAALDAWADPFDLYVATRWYAKRATYTDVQRSGLALFGTVNEIAEKMVRLHEWGSIKYLRYRTLECCQKVRYIAQCARWPRRCYRKKMRLSKAA